MLADFYRSLDPSKKTASVLFPLTLLKFLICLTICLACYDPTQPIFIGERYGYGMNTGGGYPYITGGGGMLFSKAAVKAWKDGNCNCPAPNSPDDMMIGMCMVNMEVPIVHRNNFHQARPDDYRYICLFLTSDIKNTVTKLF